VVYHPGRIGVFYGGVVVNRFSESGTDEIANRKEIVTVCPSVMSTSGSSTPVRDGSTVPTALFVALYRLGESRTLL
jgi:hypothetical protein